MKRIINLTKDKPNRLLMEDYFEDVHNIRRINLFESFSEKVWRDNDADALKFAILYFIHAFIFSGEKSTKKLPGIHFDLVESGQ